MRFSLEMESAFALFLTLQWRGMQFKYQVNAIALECGDRVAFAAQCKICADHDHHNKNKKRKRKICRVLWYPGFPRTSNGLRRQQELNVRLVDTVVESRAEQKICNGGEAK